MVPLLVPSLVTSEINDWIGRVAGSVNALDVKSDDSMNEYGLIRDCRMKEACYVFQDVKFVTAEDIVSAEVANNGCKGHVSRSKHFQDLEIENNQNYIVLEVTRFPKRKSFLHQNEVPSKEPSIEWLPAELCFFDRLPFRFCLLAKIVPSLVHKLHIAFAVQEISCTLLKVSSTPIISN